MDEGAGTRLQRGVLVAVMAVAMGVLLGAQYAYPLLAVPMSQELGWSRSATSAAFSVRFLVGAAVQLFLGWLVDRHGPKRVGALCAVVAGLGLGLTGTVRELWQVHVLFGGLVAVGAALVELSVLTTLTLAFDTGRGGAIGLTWAGGGAGMFVLLPLSQWLTTQMGWRPVFLLLGLAVIGLAPMIAATFPRGSPDGRTQEPLVERGSRMQALTLPAFWLLFIGNAFVGVFDEAVYQHLVPFAMGLGFLPVLASLALGVASVSYVVGQAIGGALSDRLGREAVVAGASAITVASLAWLLLLRSPQPIALLVTVALYGLGLGANLATRTAAWADVFAGPNFASIAGIISAGYSVGGAFIAWFGGRAFDTLKSYRPAFLAAIAAAALWVAALCWAAPRKWSARPRVSADGSPSLIPAVSEESPWST